MFEFHNNPAFLPALYGFLAGVILLALISSIRGRNARRAAQGAQKAAAEKLANLASEKSALETEIGKLRSNEARLMKHQGQLEGLAKSEAQKAKEWARLAEATREAVQTGLQAREKVILDAIAAIQTTEPARPGPIIPNSPEDLDFVPLENLPAAPAKGTAFEGFDRDQSASKAESAANAFRAALNDNDS